MFKRLTFSPGTEEDFCFLLPGDDSSLFKRASQDLHPEILAFLEKHPAEEGFLRVIINALGAYEGYGPNNNGDAFYVEDLLKIVPSFKVPMYKTYELFGKPYKHHINKPNDPSYGNVCLAVWNPEMKRVELVVDINRNDAPDICDQIDSGNFPETSMGFDCSYDVCSVCGNEAQNRSEYCEHAANQLLTLQPNGHLVHLRNPVGRFYDISFVSRGADRTSRVLRKVAGSDRHGFVGHSAIDEGEKSADIKKELPAEIALPPIPDSQRIFAEVGAPQLRDLEKRLPDALIDEMSTGNYSLPEILDTLVLLGIKLHPDEFQEILLRRRGENELAGELRANGVVFDEIEGQKQAQLSQLVFLPSGENISKKLARQILDHPDNPVENRSYHRVHLAKRAISFYPNGEDFPRANIRTPFKKEPVPQGVLPSINIVNNVPDGNNGDASASVDEPSINPFLPLAGLGALYGGIRWLGNESNTNFDRFLRKNPGWVIPVLGASLIATALGQEAAKHYMRKGAAFSGEGNPVNSIFFRSLVSIPALYTAAQLAKEKRRRDGESNVVLESIEKNPLIWSMLPIIAGGKAYNWAEKGLKPIFAQISKAASAEDVGEYSPHLLDLFIMNTAFDVGCAEI